MVVTARCGIILGHEGNRLAPFSLPETGGDQHPGTQAITPKEFRWTRIASAH